MKRHKTHKLEQQPHVRIREARRPSAFVLALILAGLLSAGGTLFAFCGFYVARADTALFNKSSRVVLVREGDRTVLTMANDFQGDLKEFAVVIPVPTFIEKGQIHVGDTAVLDHLDAYSAPRLVEYFDDDPCRQRYDEEDMRRRVESPRPSNGRNGAKDSLGVTVEATYTVGEYDILILSARESSGLETWLTQNGYRIPKGASRVLETYVKTGMRFFVAKVNLKEQAKLGFTYLRPIQVAYETAKFMLPIRLGMVNAQGPQDLFVFALTTRGRVETTNYRTVKLPSGTEIPPFVKGEFANFYKDLFAEQVRKENMKAVFLEYAWDMAWCDPCASEPLTPEELKKLGVFWLDERSGGAPKAFLTRIHLRYDEPHFPDDLVFQETADRANFQARYVLRHPFKGTASCDAGKRYFKRLSERQETEARALSSLTGWDINAIRQKMGVGAPATGEKRWWERLWKE